MNEETYRIKSLEWERKGQEPRECWQAKSVLGVISIVQFSLDEIILYSPSYPENVASIDDGKAKAEAYYRSRLLSALEPVPCKETT